MKQERLNIIKIGGNIVDDEEKLRQFLLDFAALSGKKILVHGGGKLATRLAEALNIPQQMVEGRRITDAETLKVVTMVYAGLINKNIVAALQSAGCDAIGLSGADGDVVRAHKRVHASMDYGFAGDVDEVNISLLSSLLHSGHAVVLAPITHDGNGQLLNTNADTIAQEIATAMSLHWETHLIFGFEKPGVLLDANDDHSVVSTITWETYAAMKEKHQVFAGMIPKLDNAFRALDSGVASVIIGKAEEIQQLIERKKGSAIVND